MASTPQTSGFQVSVMPQTRFADPAFFSSPLLNVGTGAMQGFNFGQNIEQQAYTASLRPLRRQLLEAQVSAAPVHQALQRLAIQQAQRQLAEPMAPVITNTTLQGGPSSQYLLREGVGPEDETITYKPLTRVESGYVPGLNGPQPFSRS